MEKKLDGLVALLTGAQSISSSTPTMSDQEQAAIGLANLAPSISRHYGAPSDHPMPDLSTSQINIAPCLAHPPTPPRPEDPASYESDYSKIPLEDVIGRNL